MDYYQNFNNLKNTITNEDTTTIPSYQQQLQLQTTYPYSDDFQKQATDNNEIQLLTTTSNNNLFGHGIRQQEQSWNTHSILDSTANEIIHCNTNEDLLQPERGIAGFVSKLYQCLQAPDDGQKYARWCRHNGIDMFIIDCIPKFTETVLPRLFKHCKFASFVRQLNIYGFQRDTDARKSKDSKDKETCRWHHIHFRPGRRDLFHLIRRKTPRYSRSRRKRPICEEEEEDDDEVDDDDPETILNIGSGDDGEIENSIVFLDEGTQNNGSLERRRSTSDASSSISTFHHQQNVNIEYNKTGQLHMIYESPQHEFDPYLQLAQNGSSPTSSSPAYSQFPSNSGNSIIPLTMTISTGSGIDNNDPHENLMAPQSIQDQPPQDDEEQLRAEIDQLRRGYARMYKTLCGEVNKAANLIEVQRNRIEYLENAIHESNNHHQQMRLRQQAQFIDTSMSNNTMNNFSSNSNNNTDGMLYQSQPSNVTPITPIYAQPHQQHHTLQSQQLPSPSDNRIVQHDEFGFLYGSANNASIGSRTEDEYKISSVTSSERWLSSTPNIARVHQQQPLTDS